MTDPRVSEPVAPGEVRGDRFRALYESHYTPVYAFVLRRLHGARADAADVTSEVFAVAWRRLEDLPAPPDDRLWLFGVARRVVSRHERTARRRFRLGQRLGADHAGVRDADEAQTLGDPRRAAVREAMARLRPAEREVLGLVFWEQLSHAEAAVILGCSVNAVGLRLHKARRRLRQALTDDGTTAAGGGGTDER